MTEAQKQLNEQIRILTFARAGWGIDEKSRLAQPYGKPFWTVKAPDTAFDFEHCEYRVALPRLPEGYRLLEMGENIPTGSAYMLVNADLRPVDRNWYSVNCGLEEPTPDCFIIIPTTPTPTYLDKHKASGIKVGDLVELARYPIKEDEDCGWNPAYFGFTNCEENIGKHLLVSKDKAEFGFVLGRENSFCFPATCLRKITMKTVPLDQSDWLTSPVWWVCRDTEADYFLVTSISRSGVWWGGGFVRHENMTTLKRSTDLKTWTPCWKEVEA